MSNIHKNPKMHVIAYIDLLGTSDRMHTDSDYQTFSTVQHVYDQLKRAYLHDLAEEHIKVKFFSDNVIIAKEIVSENDKDISFLLNQMIGLAAVFQFTFLCCRWPCRGGLTIGDLFIDDTFVWGTGLLRAYELESKLAVFPRIIIDPKLLDTIISKHPDNVRSFRMDGGLPIVDSFALMREKSASELICPAIKELIDKANEKTIGKIEWIRESYNIWCRSIGAPTI